MLTASDVSQQCCFLRSAAGLPGTLCWWHGWDQTRGHGDHGETKQPCSVWDFWFCWILLVHSDPLGIVNLDEISASFFVVSMVGWQDLYSMTYGGHSQVREQIDAKVAEWREEGKAALTCHSSSLGSQMWNPQNECGVSPWSPLFNDS